MGSLLLSPKSSQCYCQAATLVDPCAFKEGSFVLAYEEAQSLWRYGPITRRHETARGPRYEATFRKLKDLPPEHVLSVWQHYSDIHIPVTFCHSASFSTPRVW